ncbi:MAG: putative coding region [Chloroflexi bacterium]|nr:putative coding region [Chloroflexota bacterium]
MGKPDKFTVQTLELLGFRSRNDRTMLGVLKFIGLISDTGEPTELWMELRSDARKALGKGINAGYKALFELYSDAPTRNRKDIENFFRTNTSGGERVIAQTVVTFTTLCKLADFDTTTTPMADDPVHATVGTTGEVARAGAVMVGPALTLNINIQLSLPESSDESVYDRIFSSMKRHLIQAYDRHN